MKSKRPPLAAIFCTLRERSCGKGMFLHPSVSHSVRCPSVCLDTLPIEQTPLTWADTLPGRHPLGKHPLDRHPPPHRRLLLRTVRIIPECILVMTYFYRAGGGMAPLPPSPGSATIHIKFFVHNQQQKNDVSDIGCIRFYSARCILHIRRSYSRLLNTFGE